MTENVNVKSIKCSGPLTFHAARIAIDVNYLMEEINNGLYSGKASVRDEAFRANSEIAELLSKLQSDLKSVSSRMQKAMRSNATRRTNTNSTVKTKTPAKSKTPVKSPAPKKAKVKANTTTKQASTKSKPTETKVLVATDSTPV